MAPSEWVLRWRHLAPPGSPVLDVACGRGRHLPAFHAAGHPLVGVDRDGDALAAIDLPGEWVQADIESGDWPFRGRQFGAVVVTHYLHRPLLATLVASVAPGGVLLYETFATGQERVGRPSRPEFLLEPGELLRACDVLHTVAYEDGWLHRPERRVQRIAAVRLGTDGAIPALAGLAGRSIPDV